jgi:hypothetical protein
METLVLLPVCEGDKLATLNGEMELTKESVSRMSVSQIENFCLNYQCPGEEKRDEESAKSKASYGKAHTLQGYRLSQTVSSPFCHRFCDTKHYFSEKIPFTPKLHLPLAKEVKGNKLYEEIHLRHVILQDKKLLLNMLDSQSLREGSGDGEKMHNKDSDMDSSISSGQKFSTRIDTDMSVLQGSKDHEDQRLWTDEDGCGNGYGSDGDAVLLEPCDEMKHEDDLVSGEYQFHRHHHNLHTAETKSNHHMSCRDTLCTLQTISQAAAVTPVLGLAFNGLNLGLQASLSTLRMISKAEEVGVLFEDLQICLEAAVMYLEKGGRDRVVFLSIANYTMVSETFIYCFLCSSHIVKYC